MKIKGTALLAGAAAGLIALTLTATPSDARGGWRGGGWRGGGVGWRGGGVGWRGGWARPGWRGGWRGWGPGVALGAAAVGAGVGYSEDEEALVRSRLSGLGYI